MSDWGFEKLPVRVLRFLKLLIQSLLSLCFGFFGSSFSKEVLCLHWKTECVCIDCWLRHAMEDCPIRDHSSGSHRRSLLFSAAALCIAQLVMVYKDVAMMITNLHFPSPWLSGLVLVLVLGKLRCSQLPTYCLKVLGTRSELPLFRFCELGMDQGYIVWIHRTS